MNGPLTPSAAYSFTNSELNVSLTFLYGTTHRKLPQFADAHVIIHTDEDGLARAKVSKGKARRPTWMRNLVVRNWHSIEIVIAIAAYCLFHPKETMYEVSITWMGVGLVVAGCLLAPVAPPRPSLL